MAFQKRRHSKKISSFLLLVLAIITNKCISDIPSVSGSVTESTVHETNAVISNNIEENLSNGSYKEPSTALNQTDKLRNNGSHSGDKLIDDVQDSQVEGDSSHDEAYNSIIANYYTADPFFGSSGGGQRNANTPLK